MRRFFVEQLPDEGGTCMITGAEARHIARVLRMKPGDRMVLMDGKGRRFQAAVGEIGRHEVHAVLEARLPNPSPSPVEITLLQALIKSGPMDYLIQKTSELGADRLIPFEAIRSVVRPDETRLEKKMTHWKKVAKSAAKQSGRTKPLKVLPVSSFESLLGRYKDDHALKVILWEEEDSTDLKEVLRATPAKRHYAGMIGPEGGFSGEEVDLAQRAGFIPVSLGRRILRAETAAIAITAIVQYELGDLGHSCCQRAPSRS